MLTVRCHFHPRYAACTPPTRDCQSCKLLYVLAHQRDRETDVLLEEVGFPAADMPDYGEQWEQALSCLDTGKRSPLTIRCQHHRYRATRRPAWGCSACWLLYVLKYQGHEDGERRLGPFNPYAFVLDLQDLEEACTNLRVANLARIVR